MKAETKNILKELIKDRARETIEVKVISDEQVMTGLKYFQKINPEFVIDKDNIDLIIDLIHYFHQANRKYDVNKGLFLYGNVGVGKTYLLTAFNNYASKIRRLESSSRDNSSFDTISVETLILKQDRDILFKKNNILIDELGIEKDYKIIVYGTPASNYIDLVFMELYASRFLKGKKVHVTSNFTPKDIKTKYSRRLLDRFIEMFNFIEIKGESRRK